MLILAGYTVHCRATRTCGERYEVTRADGTPPARPRDCRMPECGARVAYWPIYRAAERSDDR